jgi:hypothetical protein
LKVIGIVGEVIGSLNFTAAGGNPASLLEAELTRFDFGGGGL